MAQANGTARIPAFRSNFYSIRSCDPTARHSTHGHCRSQRLLLAALLISFLLVTLPAIVLPAAADVTPVAAFTATPLSGPVPLTVQFIDQSTNSPTSWSWDFGDGQTSAARNPGHMYIAQGLFTVTLTASNEAGSDSEMKIGYITVGNPAQSLVFITSTDTDRKTARKGDLVNVSIRLIAGQASPLDGMIMLDRSGDSMYSCMESVAGICQYTRWDLAKEGALAFTASASANSNLGVSWFATRGGIAHTLDNSQVQVSNEILAMNYIPYGYTPEPYTGPGTGGVAGMSNLRDGLYRTIKYLGPVPHEKLRTKAVVIFTDGVYNWYGNPIAHGRGTALRTRIARVECSSGYPGNGCADMISGMMPYDPVDVDTYREDAMWWPGSSCQAGSCSLPTWDYTFYNWIKDERENGGWLNFTGLSWNGGDYLGDPAHIAYPTYTGDGLSYSGYWPVTSACSACELCGYIHCDSNYNTDQFQLDVSAPEWPYIEYTNGVKVLRGSSEQTEQNMTIFARDYNIRLYLVVIRNDADTGTSMPQGYATADDMMKILAYTTGGKYYAVHSRDDLYASIDDITRDLASAATKDLTMDIEDTAVDVNSLLTVNMDNQVFAHQHLQDVSTTIQSWDMEGIPIQEITTIPEAQDWLSTHRLTYPVGDLDVGDTFLMNYTVQVYARGRINAIGPDSVVSFKDGYELPLPPTYIDVENIPPVFIETGDKVIDRLDPLTFTIAATDVDEDPLTYSSVLLPTGATFNADTRGFSWGGEKERGLYEVIFSVTDGMATVTQTVYITVTDLRPKINIS